MRSCPESFDLKTTGNEGEAMQRHIELAEIGRWETVPLRDSGSDVFRFQETGYGLERGAFP